MKYLSKGEIHVGWGKAMHEPPSSFMGSIPHVNYQTTINQ